MVTISDYPLPPGYSCATTTLLLKLPVSFPNGKPDMFWTEEGLLLANGQIPTNADNIEEALGKKWRRFSWHPQNWQPGVDSLFTFLEFVNLGLQKARGK